MNILLSFVALLLLGAVALALFSWYVARRAEAAVPATGQWLEVDGERIHYRSFGEGPPLVLVHGLGGQMQHFNYLPLQQLARRYRVVLIDRPGSGHSPRRDDGKAGIAAQARLVEGFIRAMRFAQPPLVVGHSLGGAIALGVALRAPECVQGLALIAPLTHVGRDVPEAFRALLVRRPWLRRLFGWTLAVPLGILRSRSTLCALFGPDREPRDFALRGGGLLSLRPSLYYSASTDMCAVEDDLVAQQERYGELSVPVYILYAEGDRILDWRLNGEGLQAKAPRARLQLVPGGHMLPVSQAEQTAAWLQGVAEASWDPAQ